MIRSVRDKVHKPVVCSAVKWVKAPFCAEVGQDMRRSIYKSVVCFLCIEHRSLSGPAVHGADQTHHEANRCA